VGQALERALIGPTPVTLISEDCWGGEFCRTLGCAYTTPLAGAFMEAEDYLDFLENFDALDAFHLRPVTGPRAYPVGRTPYATIHFMHATTWKEAAAAFRRRAARINPGQLFFKIDFGKAGYTPRDVDRWNKLALPNAIALLPPDPRPTLDFKHVHQGWRMRTWSFDGAAMFHLSRRAFDFQHWIRTGTLRTCQWNRALNFLFWDRLAPSETAAKIRALLLGSADRPRKVPLRHFQK
jgi:uncharacterized protein (DUF1919 family)